MKFVLCLALLSFVNFSHTKISVHTELSLASKALRQIITDFFTPKSLSFDLIVYGSMTRNISDIVDEISVFVDTPVKVIHLKEKTEHFSISNSAIILFEDRLDWYLFHKNRAKLAINYRKKVVLFCFIENDDWYNYRFENQDQERILAFEYYLNRYGNEVFMHSFEVHQHPNACDIQYWHRVNVFSGTTGKWNHSNFDVNEKNNLNTCKLKILVNKYPNQVFYENPGGNSARVHGLGAKINEEISKKLNYTFEYHQSASITEESKRSSQFFELTSLPMWKLRTMKITNSVMTTPFATDHEIFLISKPSTQPFWLIRNVLSPFNVAVWVCILVTVLVAAAAVIFILKFAPTMLLKLVYESKSQAPMMNIA